jgi:hypothetical protein
MHEISTVAIDNHEASPAEEQATDDQQSETTPSKSKPAARSRSKTN